MAFEEEGPSKVLLLMTAIPPIFLVAIFRLTDNFSTSPTLPPLYYKIMPLALTFFAIVVSIMGFLTARDEEPEWGSRLPFKVIEAVHLAYIAVSLLLASLVVTLYFL